MHIDKKLVALPMLAAIILSVAGFVYAHWTDDIYINGEIHMANMTLAFTHNILEPPLINEWPEPKGKDVGNTTAWYEKEFQDSHTGKWGYEELWINITNAYPCYGVGVVFVVENIGLLPLHVYDYEITDPSGTLTWDMAQGALVDANNNPIISISFVDLICKQIEPEDDPNTFEEDNKAKAEIDIHIEQPAEECHTYYFKVGILYEQYDP
jgi:hypothetical protein